MDTIVMYFLGGLMILTLMLTLGRDFILWFNGMKALTEQQEKTNQLLNEINQKLKNE